MTIRHVAVWIDHKEAKIFHIEPESFDMQKISSPHEHVTHKGEAQAKNPDHKRFFHEVGVALKDAQEILLVGPSSAKLDFIRYLHTHDKQLEERVLGVETLDHPTDGQLAAYVRHYFQGVQAGGSAREQS